MSTTRTKTGRRQDGSSPFGRASIQFAPADGMPRSAAIARARGAVEALRRRGEVDEADIVEELLQAVDTPAVPALDMLTTGQTAQLIGVTGQTIKNWVNAGTFPGYRVGNRIMIPREKVEEYVRRARTSLDLDEMSDEEAAESVREGRRH